MTERHIIGNTGPHKRISLRKLHEGPCANDEILDEHQGLYAEVAKCKSEVARIENDEEMLPFHKRVQLESAQRKIKKLAQETQTKTNAVLRRQRQTRKSFSGEILSPRESQKISSTIVSEAEREFKEKLRSLQLIQVELDTIVQKVETLLVGLPETL